MSLFFSNRCASLLMVCFVTLCGLSQMALATDANIHAETETDTAEEPPQTEHAQDNNANEVPPELPLDLTKKLGVEKRLSGWQAQFSHYLEAQGLDTDITIKILISGAIVLLGFVLAWVFNKVFRWLIERCKPVIRRYSLSPARFRFYLLTSRVIVGVQILLFLLSLFVEIWMSADVIESINSTLFVWIENLASAFVVFMLAAVVTEVASIALERLFVMLDAEHSARTKTLKPIAQNILSTVVILVFGLTFLSEIGINVIPLLAGAGVAGLAVGFGAQALVKDIITGFIIILEDLFHIGDVVRVAGRIGLVERITIRKVQLRDLSGIVYTVPFGEINVVENLTKEFSYYLFDIGVAYREDTDHVIEIMRSVDQELREDEKFSPLILDPLEVLGVDAFAQSAVVIKARIRTLPIRQWDVGREFKRRLKYAFDAAGVEIPFPHQTLYFGEDKKGRAPAGHIKVQVEKNFEQDHEQSISNSDETVSQ